jgi:hypothetical protein
MEVGWLIRVSIIDYARGTLKLRLDTGGQWAIPCNTADILSFTFKYVYQYILFGRF